MPSVAPAPPVEPVAATATSATTVQVARQEPRLVGAARGQGPFESVCDGLPTLETGELDTNLTCDGDEPYERATLASPVGPFDAARVVFASADMPGHDEMGALVLDVRSSGAHHLVLLGVNAGDLIGSEPASALAAEELHIERAGDSPRLVFTLRTESRPDDRDDRPDRSDAPASGPESYRVYCALERATLACARVQIAGGGAVRSAAGRTPEHAAWSVRASLGPDDRVVLSDPTGTPPGDLDEGRARALVFSDLGRTPARTLGNRCHRLLAADELDRADEACTAGLASRPSRDEHGALLYDRGRIAEARGDVGRAREAYTASLAVRPGNAAVQARLAALPE